MPSRLLNYHRMPSILTGVRAQVKTFMAGGPFLPLRDVVNDAAHEIDDDKSLSDAERDWFDELFDAVSMAADDPVDARARKDGIVGAAELREQLALARLDRF